MSAAGDLSAAAQHLPDVERRRCWSILEAGFLSLIPSPYAKRPEKRWLYTRRSSFCWEKRVAVEALLLVIAPFRTEAVLTVLHRNDPPWPRLDSVVRKRTRLPDPRATRTRSCTLCNNQILESWMNVACALCACDETRPWSIAKTCSHAVSAHGVDFEHVETKLETSRGVHWQRWTPPVYAPDNSDSILREFSYFGKHPVILQFFSLCLTSIQCLDALMTADKHMSWPYGRHTL